jgi:hypothetical protein
MVLITQRSGIFGRGKGEKHRDPGFFKQCGQLFTDDFGKLFLLPDRESALSKISCMIYKLPIRLTASF